MIIQLARLAAAGIYNTPNGLLPPKWARLQRDAAKALRAVKGFENLIFSDMFRTPEQSLQAMQTKAGVMPPGKSAHNFGLAVDIALDDYIIPGTTRREHGTLKRLNCTFAEICDALRVQGWYCHRRDGVQKFEAWHFNYLEPHAEEALALTDVDKSATWSFAAEYVIQKRFSLHLTLSNHEVQTALAKLRMYNGEIDGIMGLRTRTAISAFQRAWHLEDSSFALQQTHRVLAIVTADIEEVTL